MLIEIGRGIEIPLTARRIFSSLSCRVAATIKSEDEATRGRGGKSSCGVMSVRPSVRHCIADDRVVRSQSAAPLSSPPPRLPPLSLSSSTLTQRESRIKPTTTATPPHGREEREAGREARVGFASLSSHCDAVWAAKSLAIARGGHPRCHQLIYYPSSPSSPRSATTEARQARPTNEGR